MKNYTFYKAVAGGVRTTELNKYTLEVNYLVFNDSTEGHFYVIPISALPELTKDDGKGISIKYNGKNALILNNEWLVNSREESGNKKINSYQKAYSRMRKLMLELASMSVNVHLAINQVKNLSKFH